MSTETVVYETRFANQEPITSYMAVGLAEGFEETSEARDVLRAWSYLIGTRQAYSLQGWFGRQAASIIETGIIGPDGAVDWEEVDARLQG